MIIYGTKGLRSKGDPGEFYCPQCGQGRAYEWIRVRRWFTLYFIPLIPMNLAGEYLECRGCLGTFKPDARERGPEHYVAESRKFEAEFQQAMKGVMILTLLADGRVEQEELDTIRQIYGQLTRQDYPADVLSQDVREFERAGTSTKDYLSDISGRLNDSGKAMVYKAALLVAMADGEVAREEEALLTSIGKALGLTKKQIESLRSTIS